MNKNVIKLPSNFESVPYRTLWPDLAEMSDAELEVHYHTWGVAEGRRANNIVDRMDFVRLIPMDRKALEIGPFFRPMIRGDQVSYFDVLDRHALQERAKEVGRDQNAVPVIQHVSPTGDLSCITDVFANVLSSHCIEHQPDLVRHLRHVSRLLEPDGRYFLLIPDKRYCFDAFNRETTISDVLDRYRANRSVHELRSVIDHRAMTTHNDPPRHWGADHGLPGEGACERIQMALAEFDQADGAYIDVHASFFTPDSFAKIISLLKQLNLIDLQIDELYPTRHNCDEFWVVLAKK